MVKVCTFCNKNYDAKTKRSCYCSDKCKNTYWYSLNKECKKEYYQNNIDTIKNREKSYTLSGKRKEKNLKWYDKNGLSYYANKRQSIEYKMTKNLRTRLYKAIKNNWKSGSAISDLGCSIDELKNHLESKFQEGMSWDNYGQWHIDHIKPLVSFDLANREELKQACHYTNLQPLWARDNISKGAK